MKNIFLFFALLICFTVLGKLIATDAGYVLIQIQDIVIETSVFILLISAVMFVFILFALIRTGRNILNASSILNHYRTKRNLKRAQVSLERGMLFLLEENWEKAENELKFAAKHPAFTLSASLGLTQVSNAKANWQQGLEYLSTAEKNLTHTAGPGLKLAEIDQSIKNSKWHEAAKALAELHKNHKKHPAILRRLMQVYAHQNNWEALLELAPTAAKSKALSEDALGALCQTAITNSLIFLLVSDESSITQGAEQRATHHQQAVKSALSQPAAKYLSTDHFTIMAQTLNKAGAPDASRQVLEHVLMSTTDENALNYYGALECENIQAQIHFLTTHQRQLENCWAFGCALGQLKARMGDNEAASVLFEKSLKIKPSAKALIGLANIYSKQQNYQRSDAYYNRAVSLNPTL